MHTTQCKQDWLSLGGEITGNCNFTVFDILPIFQMFIIGKYCVFTGAGWRRHAVGPVGVPWLLLLTAVVFLSVGDRAGLRQEQELSRGTGQHGDRRRRGPRGSGCSPRLWGDRGRCGFWAPAPGRVPAGVAPPGLPSQSRAWVPVTEGKHSFWNQISVKFLREVWESTNRNRTLRGQGGSPWKC